MHEGALQLKIMSPDEIVWEGSIDSLSAENREGPFDVLPGHANFITLLTDTEVTLRFNKNRERVFEFEHAVLYVAENNAKIYIHSAQSLNLEEGVTLIGSDNATE